MRLIIGLQGRCIGESAQGRRGETRDRRNNPQIDIGVRREARLEENQTIPCGEHSSMRLIIGLQGRCMGRALRRDAGQERRERDGDAGQTK